jgi:hypothetical protein
MLRNPEFDSKDVDPDLHKRLEKAVHDGRIKCFNMREGRADGDQDLNFWTRELEDVVREIMEDPVFKGNQNFHFELDLDEAGKRLFGGEANAGVAFQIGQLRYIPVCYRYIPVHTLTYCVILDCTDLYLYLCFRVGEGTVPLAIVLYIDGSFVKHKIPVKPIYVSVRNLNSTVSGKACAWRVLGMMPSLKKSATLDQTDTWRKERRLRLHHACIAHVVEMVNKFGSEDKHLLCADGQVHTSTY